MESNVVWKRFVILYRCSNHQSRSLFFFFLKTIHFFESVLKILRYVTGKNAAQVARHDRNCSWISFRSCWNIYSLVVSKDLYTRSDGHTGGSGFLFQQFLILKVLP